MLRKLAGLTMLMVAGSALLFPAPALRAQELGDDARAQFAGMQRVSGEITAVNGSTLTLKGADGAVTQVVTTDNTRVMKRTGGGAAPATVKVSDLKVGDGVMAMGNLDAPNKTMHAAMLGVQDAAELKKLKDNLGKTYIAGKVTGIDADNAKMTVQRPDGVAQTIGFDETTSFKRGRLGRGGGGMGGGQQQPTAPVASGESITLADIKVGDNVSGTGTVKSGVFVPTVLTVGTPGQGRHRGADGEVAKPDGATPAPGPGF